MLFKLCQNNLVKRYILLYKNNLYAVVHALHIKRNVKSVELFSFLWTIYPKCQDTTISSNKLPIFSERISYGNIKHKVIFSPYRIKRVYFIDYPSFARR